MDPISLLIALGPAIIGAIGRGVAGSQQAGATRSAASAQERSATEAIEWERESALMGQKATEEENRRRQVEASFRAANLEDVIKMFEGLGNSGEMAGMSQIAQQLMSGDGGTDLRKNAMRELDMNSGMLNAMLAQSGVTGSGFGAQQQRGLMTDTMMGLARDMTQNRTQNLMGAANLLGQSQQMNMGRLGAIGSLYQDDAFGANAPMDGFPGGNSMDWSSLLSGFAGGGGGGNTREYENVVNGLRRPRGMI